MAQIRATIELLSKIFKENGATKVKAEYFRLGKFNKDEAAEPLWKLLFELLYYLDYGKIDDVTVRAYAQMSKEEVVVYVKREISKRGYISYDLSLVSNDMNSGSRELLLALGWLLCKHGVITCFMHNVTSPLDDDTAYLYQEEESGDFSELDEVTCRADPVSRVHQLLWLNNKLRLNLRNLHALQRQKNILQHKVHEATLGVSMSPAERPHLTALEVYMLRHPDVLKKNLQLVERDNQRLNNLLQWREQEDGFWRWMESVLDEKKKAVASATSTVNEQEMKVPSYVMEDLQSSHLNLQQAITKYEAIVDHLDIIWEQQNESVTEEELDSVLRSIELELSIQKANIALNSCETFLENSPPKRPKSAPTFIYMPEGYDKQKKKTSSASSQGSLAMDDVRDIQDEIKELQAVVDAMEKDVTDKQDAFRDEMTQLSHKFQDAICIPPMARKTYGTE